MGSFVFVSLIATLALAFVMMLRGFSVGSIAICLVLGGMITGFLLAKQNGKSGMEGIVSGVVFTVVLMVATPALALGILFMGCTVCAK